MRQPLKTGDQPLGILFRASNLPTADNAPRTLRRSAAGIQRRPARRQVAFHHQRQPAGVKNLMAEQPHVGRLQHRIRRVNGGHHAVHFQ